MDLCCENKIISSDARLCNSFFLRLKGLMFSRKLRDDECLILENASDIHMLFVFQSIDAVWLGKDKIMTDKKENIKPFSFLIRPKIKSYYVVELPLGKAKLFKSGNRVDFK